MHELSLAAEVIKLAESEAEKHSAISVNEITIEVGDFSGVQAEAFRSALEILLPEKAGLRNTSINIVRKKGKGICAVCRQEFDMEHRIDTCPVCGEFPAEITGGYEFRVVSLSVETD